MGYQAQSSVWPKDRPDQRPADQCETKIAFCSSLIGQFLLKVTVSDLAKGAKTELPAGQTPSSRARQNANQAKQKQPTTLA